MPTYEYECEACGHRYEKFQSMAESPTRKCPKCGKLKASRIIHGGAGILFKGSGFYQTDYRSKGYKEAAEKDKSHGAKAKGKPSPSTPCSGDCSSCPDAKK